MSEHLYLKVFTPEKLFLNESILKINIQGKEGNFSMLPKHADYITSFRDGIISYMNANDNKCYFLAVNQGFLVKTGHYIDISVFNAVSGMSLLELKEKVKKLSIDIITETDEEINKTLQNIEFMMLSKIVGFKKYD